MPDETLIVLRLDFSDARRRAAFDLKQQTRPRTAFEHGVRTTAQQERALQRVQRAIDRTRRSKGTEVIAFAVLGAAMLDDLRRHMITGDENVGKRLVVPQRHVEARLQTFDEIGFEQQRLDLGRRLHELHRRRRRDHPRDAARVTEQLGVRRNALLEVRGLADVEHLAFGIEHAVDARRIRQTRQIGRDRCRAGRERPFVEVGCFAVVSRHARKLSGA